MTFPGSVDGRPGARLATLSRLGDGNPERWSQGVAMSGWAGLNFSEASARRRSRTHERRIHDKRILYVDDELSMRLAVARLLRGAGADRDDGGLATRIDLDLDPFRCQPAYRHRPGAGALGSSQTRWRPGTRSRARPHAGRRHRVGIPIRRACRPGVHAIRSPLARRELRRRGSHSCGSHARTDRKDKRVFEVR
jgi:hypothetical protein